MTGDLERLRIWDAPDFAGKLGARTRVSRCCHHPGEELVCRGVEADRSA